MQTHSLFFSVNRISESLTRRTARATLNVTGSMMSIANRSGFGTPVGFVVSCMLNSSGSVFNSASAAFSFILNLSVGAYSLTCTGLDSNSLSATCTLPLAVRDLEPPQFVCTPTTLDLLAGAGFSTFLWNASISAWRDPNARIPCSRVTLNYQSSSSDRHRVDPITIAGTTGSVKLSWTWSEPRSIISVANALNRGSSPSLFANFTTNASPGNTFLFELSRPPKRSA